MSLEGHEEEVLCLKCVVVNGQNYIVTSSQDGYIMRWDLGRILYQTRMSDTDTCMAFSFSFIPNTGNRLFLAACDDRL
ncbi:hypothetical protein BC829DRAFT_397675, partial [Chytridium lagenaria]